MLVEILSCQEHTVANRTFGHCAAFVVFHHGGSEAVLCRGCRRPFAIWRRLFHIVHSRKVPLEYIRTVESLFIGRAYTMAEGANHGPFIVGKRMPVFVVFACKSFRVIFTCLYGALLRSLFHMGKHVGCNILVHAPALWIWTSVPIWVALLFILCSRRARGKLEIGCHLVGSGSTKVVKCRKGWTGEGRRNRGHIWGCLHRQRVWHRRLHLQLRHLQVWGIH